MTTCVDGPKPTVNAFACEVHDETSWTRTGVPGHVLEPLEPRGVGASTGSLQRAASPTAPSQPPTKANEARDRDDHRRSDQPPAPEPAGEADDQHDADEHRDRLGEQRRPLRDRASAPTLNGPRPQWCCHQRSASANGSATNHTVTSTTIAATIAAVDAPEPDLPDARRQAPREHGERDELRERRDQPEHVLAAREAARPRERRARRSSGSRRDPTRWSDGTLVRQSSHAHANQSERRRTLAWRPSPCAPQSSPTSTPIFTH